MGSEGPPAGSEGPPAGSEGPLVRNETPYFNEVHICILGKALPAEE